MVLAEKDSKMKTGEQKPLMQEMERSALPSQQPALGSCGSTQEQLQNADQQGRHHEAWDAGES